MFSFCFSIPIEKGFFNNYYSTKSIFFQSIMPSHKKEKAGFVWNLIVSLLESAFYINFIKHDGTCHIYYVII